MVVADRFGTGRDVDAYLIAALYPTLLSSVFTSTVAGSVVPVFHAAALKGDNALERYVAGLWSASVVILVIGGVIVLVLLGPLLGISAPGFQAGTRVLSFQLAAIMIPGGVMAGLAGCLGALLNARKEFVAPALVTVLNTAGIGLSGLLFSRELGVFSIALGSLAGSLFGLVMVWIAAGRRGIRPRLGSVFGNEHIRMTARVSAPLLLGVVTTFATLFIDRAMASTLPVGSVAALGYADKLFRLPEAIIMLTLPAVIFPYLAESGAIGDLKRVSQLSSVALALMVLLLLPAAVVFFWLAIPIVSVVFERGRFGVESVNATSMALVGYAFGVVFVGAGYLFPRILLALRKSATIGMLGCFNVLLKLVLNKLLIPVFAHQGIALATTMMYFITDVAFIFVLWRAGVRLSVRLLTIAVVSGAFIGLAAVTSAKGVALLAWPVGVQLLVGAATASVAVLLTYRFGGVTAILGRQRE
jgi:putative peptidoglycan lipid II flippase